MTRRAAGQVARRRFGGPSDLALCVLAQVAVAAIGFTGGAAGATLLSGGTRAGWFAAPVASVAPASTGASAVAGELPAAGPPPTRIRIPAIGVDSPLEVLHLDTSGALAAPRQFADAGWYADGTPPGEMGPAVIAGHVDSVRGPAVFYRLDRLRPGDLVEVARAGHWLGFRVVAVDRYAKRAFPTAAVYGPTPDPELRLITCGGVFDRARKSYVDNTVVYAVAT